VAGVKGTPVEVQMRRAVKTLRSSTMTLPGLKAVDVVQPSDWFELVSRLRLAVGAGPSILVVDEFLAEETNRGLDGLIQSLWDLDLGRRPLLLVLIGSQALADGH
jgi:ABC-type nitrate/sulfonate/bicarbonate transport system permease component